MEIEDAIIAMCKFPLCLLVIRAVILFNDTKICLKTTYLLLYFVNAS